ncbi:2-oxoacid:acceptor oxidoreductase subunit alpha [Fervidibacillus halotolerans]|uniref:2-oxoacid:acceptor oxidoreductase subunit alpha n=1 Tax=Fervidibacillus halotolerans TaxID=2980027 RepID=A0A9E8M142_9BACI|nr:2-oxoacid:acceptor oxidoreductase subunit alpha [Fervidibacillus halotolerans]WAA13525.1 2-oxoacid:acceptor oxidoreductase subunit alpha [Fervidibacillus halotolerans]
MRQLSWKIGGQQGEGIESTGEIFSAGFHKLGYFLNAYRHFSSRIKGGHTNIKVRISTKPIYTINDDLDILIAFDQETIDINYRELNKNGFILVDLKGSPKKPADCPARFYPIPFTKIAMNLGNVVMKNMVAIGATCAILDLQPSMFKPIIEDMFQHKGNTIIQRNVKALQEGYEYVQREIHPLQTIPLAPPKKEQKMYLTGNEAIGLGTIAAGCRLMFAYPITPASDIMEYLIKKLPKFGGTVIQTEDEIAACTMAIGANYGGVRAFTASSGPGLSLMMESIGLAGMTETPVVIVNTQRGGPSTGLPTKQEHSDVFAMIFGNHGEIPKVVIAPSTVEEAFYDTVEAFNIAEEYQIPVILLTDLQLSLGKQTTKPFKLERTEIRRGKITEEMEGEKDEKNKSYFKRYELVPSGISNRVFPGTRGGIHHVTGVEHDETGRPVESALNRKKQMDKRMTKLQTFTIQSPFVKKIYGEHPDLLLIGFNSTRGAIEEATERLISEGYVVNHLHIRLLHPFPKEEIKPYMEAAKQIIIIEQNATGQLKNLIHMHLGFFDRTFSINKYDGTPLLPNELFHRIKGMIKTKKEET